MSQHYFETMHEGEPTQVMMGWDRPFQGFFMVINKESDGDEPFWSNLIHADVPYPQKIEPFLAVLDSLDIKIPREIIEKTVADKLKNF